MLHYFHYINLVTKHTHHLFPVQNHFVIYNKLQNLVMSQTVYLAYIIHSGFISGYQNRYGDNLKPPTNVYHRMTA